MSGVFNPTSPYAKDVNRLISSLYPTGRVIFQDDLSVMRWNKDDMAGTGAISLDATQPDAIGHGSNALKILTGATADNETGAYRRFPFAGKVRYGFEGMINPYALTNLKRLTIGIRIKDGSKFIGYWLEWVKADTSLKYRDVTGSPQVIQSIPLTGYNLFNFKLIVDASKLEYVACHFCGLDFDLRGLKAEDTEPATTWRGADVEVTCQTSANVAELIWLADPIITVDEP